MTEINIIKKTKNITFSNSDKTKAEIFEIQVTEFIMNNTKIEIGKGLSYWYLQVSKYEERGPFVGAGDHGEWFFAEVYEEFNDLSMLLKWITNNAEYSEFKSHIEEYYKYA